MSARPWPATACKAAAGFNLVELMVVTTIAAILMGIAIPSYRYVTNSSRVSSEINELLGDMMLARAEAIRNGEPVSVCPSTNGTSCNATNWATGWIVFTDFNANGTVDTDAADNDTVLRYQSAFNGTDTVTTVNAAHNYVTFNRDGFAINMNTVDASQLTFELHTAPVAISQWTRCLQISLAGQMATHVYGQGTPPCS
jgi:type IV fimbrial biogenesis protein FimT